MPFFKQKKSWILNYMVKIFGIKYEIIALNLLINWAHTLTFLDSVSIATQLFSGEIQLQPPQRLTSKHLGVVAITSSRLVVISCNASLGVHEICVILMSV